MKFGLVIGFSEILQLTTIKDYASTVLHASRITVGHYVGLLILLQPLLGSGF
jgi:hypothetical protein